MALVCGIYDKDSNYTIRLVTFLNSCKDFPFEVVAFTEEGKLLEYLENSELDILVLSEDCQKEYLNVRRTIFISDEPGGELNVYRYQSAADVAKGIAGLCKDMCRVKSGDRQATIVGIHALSGINERSILGLNICYELAKKGKVLYICIDTFTSLDMILGTNGKNLSDVMYRYMDERTMLWDNFEDYVIGYEGVHILNGVICPEDIEHQDTSAFVELIRDVVAIGLYDYIFLDIGNLCKDSWKLVLLCERIFMLESIGICDKEWTAYIERRCGANIAGRIQAVSLPADNSFRDNVNALYRGESLLVRRYAGGLFSG